MKVFVILPTYNEADTIAELVYALLEVREHDLHVIIIDDTSPDGTGIIADRLHSEFPERVRVVHRKRKSGLGTAYIVGFRLALENGADAIIQMDSDLSHSPNYLLDFVTKIDEYDVVVGSRYVPGGKVDPRWSGWRYLLSKWANSIWVHLILNVQVRDATAGFKCWSRHALEQVPLDDVRSNGYIFQVEMAYWSEKVGLHILEWPIYFEDRRIGKSKNSVPVKIEAAWRVLEIRLRHGVLKKDSARVEYQRVSA